MTLGVKNEKSEEWVKPKRHTIDSTDPRFPQWGVGCA